MFDKKNFREKKFHPSKILFFIGLAVLFVFVTGNVVMYLWNAILPDVINAKPITFWQGVGIFILARLLFGSFKGGPPSRSKREHWKNKWTNMSEDERHEFKSKWKDHCNKKKESE